MRGSSMLTWGTRHELRCIAGRGAGPMSLLEARDVVAGYVAGLPIVHGVSVAVNPGEIVVVLGPNGAGKSTLVKAMAGVVQTFSGSVTFEGKDITGLPAHRLSAAGIGYVPQNANIFTTLSVE